MHTNFKKNGFFDGIFEQKKSLTRCEAKNEIK